MIDKIELKAGSAPNQPQLEFDVSPITIFVGPNNSGKSKVLTEIENYVRSGGAEKNNFLVLKDLEFSILSNETILSEIKKIKVPPREGEIYSDDYIVLSKVSPHGYSPLRVTIFLKSLIDEATNRHSIYQAYNTFLNFYTLRLDGTNRLRLLEDRPAGDLLNPAENHLTHLFVDDSLRAQVRRIVHEAIGKFYVIDPTQIGTLRVRLSSSPPNTEREEKSWESESIDFHKAATLINESSDGVKAFAGIITTILAGDPKIILIDEPEAFLHPALAAKLGKEIGKSLNGSEKRFVAATHSSSFLMGCIQSGAPLNIVRLTYKDQLATSRLLPKEKILHLMRNPLLRSTGVLNGLFYEAVIVTEADSDRAFYQEINERLLSSNDGRGINNCLFINAQNKQTVWDIVKPLRELGIAAVGIVDLDVVKEGGAVFKKLLEGANIPDLSHDGYQNTRGKIKANLDKTDSSWKKTGGIEVLVESEKQGAQDFFDQLALYGAFVVVNGELESWLKKLDASGHGPNWLIEIFEKMGENPNSVDYTQPTDGDVWGFIGKIRNWTDDVNRRGIPT